MRERRAFGGRRIASENVSGNRRVLGPGAAAIVELRQKPSPSSGAYAAIGGVMVSSITGLPAS